MSSPMAEIRRLRSITGMIYQRYRSATGFSAAALHCGLNLWLIPRHGRRGAAWSGLDTDGSLRAANRIDAGKLPAWIANGRLDAEPQ